MNFLDLETKLSNTNEIHKSSIGYSEKNKKVSVNGVINHNSEIVASKTNIETLRALAFVLEMNLKSEEK
jgi:hypothetical protein